MKKDDLGDRMKEYEKRETERSFLPLLPVCARLDGRAFHSFTQDLEAFNPDMTRIMQETTKYLVEESNALIGYTQSDEISLIFYSPSRRSQIFFDGKVQKLNSILASMATIYFYKRITESWKQKIGSFPQFDCRVWQVPDKSEAINTLIWREMDAVRNSIQSLGRANFSHSTLQNLNSSQIQDLLMTEKGINWSKMPDHLKRGTYFQRVKYARPYTSEEIEKLPPKHEARANPELVVVRSDVRRIKIPPLSSISNRVGFIFDGEDPIIKE